jgi:hypothetical protein
VDASGYGLSGSGLLVSLTIAVEIGGDDLKRNPNVARQVRQDGVTGFSL